MINNIQTDKIERKQWKLLPETSHLSRHPHTFHSVLFSLETTIPNITHTHKKIVLLHLLRLQCQGGRFNDLIGLFNLSNICEMATVNVEQEIAEIAHLFEMDNISQDKSPEMERTTINLTETHLTGCQLYSSANKNNQLKKKCYLSESKSAMLKLCAIVYAAVQWSFLGELIFHFEFYYCLTIWFLFMSD